MTQPVPILLYHSVAVEATPRFKRWSVEPKLFAAQMAYLSACRYTPLTVTQFAAMVDNPALGLPPRPVVISFDDGLADFYTNALPILQQYGFCATLYIPTGYVGGASGWLHPEGESQRKMLTWSQIGEIDACGIECGSHTHTHPQLDTLTRQQANNELIYSKQMLEDHLGHSVSTFSYPHGYYSKAVRRLVQLAGYTSACAVKHAFSAQQDDCYALARIIAPTDANVTTFRQLLAGGQMPVAPVHERFQTKLWRFVRRMMRTVTLHRPAIHQLQPGEIV